MMKKLLAIVRRTEDGFRGYVPKLPGCEIRAATAEQAEADITAAAKAHLAAGKEGTNAFAPDQVEMVVAVEPPPPPRPRKDGMDEIYDRLRKEFDPAELEFFLHLDEQEWVEMTDEFICELEADTAEQPVDEAKK
jgi:predicted RNase H-like HicB family nuclease